MQTTHFSPTRRDWMLYEMGLNEWHLVRGESLKGVVNFPVDEKVKVIFISDEKTNTQAGFFQDLILSFQLKKEEYLSLQKDFAVNLQLSHPVIFFLATKEDLLPQLQQQFPKANYVQSVPFSSLLSSPQAKRTLWQQIQQRGLS